MTLFKDLKALIKIIMNFILHRFERDKRVMPVLWHQAFLTFVQRYKSDISSEQKEALLELLKKQSHHTLTPEIRREIQAAKCRDIELTAPMVEPPPVNRVSFINSDEFLM
jgi:hypothetical protein